MILSIVIGSAVFADLLAPYPLGEGSITDRLAGPSAQHFFGCDLNGADVLTAMLYGARTSLYVGLATILLSMSLGVTLGLVSGYSGGVVDILIMRSVDTVMAFPGILLAMGLTALMGPSVHTVIIAIAATGWTSSARLVRGQALSLKEREYVLAGRALGGSHKHLIINHILPAALSPIIVQATFSLSGVMVVEAGLSFLGLGASDAALTWGGLLGQGSQIQLDRAPHLTMIPGAAIFALVMALNFMGDALRDAFDPKR
jgi:peptide/nickel transport system permease protein